MTRPPFAYFGGKARLAAWITGHFPPHLRLMREANAPQLTLPGFEFGN